MVLKLRVVSEQRKQLGRDSVRTFNGSGGKIGRAPDNDWVLPDNDRYVSSHHAQVTFRRGEWVLEDVSTNGTFVNDSDAALAITGPHILHSGDRLRFGDYEIEVSIDSEDSEHSTSSTNRNRRPSTPPPPSKQGRKSDHLSNDLGENLDITGLFQVRKDDDVMAALDEPQETRRPDSTSRVKKLAQDSEPEELLEYLFDTPSSSPKKAPEPKKPPEEQGSGSWHMATRRVQRPAAPPVESEPEPELEPITSRSVKMRMDTAARKALESAQGGQDPFDSFCRGVGVDFGALPGDAQTTMLTLAGQMLREVVLTLMETLKPKGEAEDAPHAPTNTNPIKSAVNIEDALRKLLQPRSSRYLSAVEAARDAFNDLGDRRIATDSAMLAAVNDLLHRLNPGELQERFDRGLQRANVPATAYKTKYWELYSEFFSLLNQRNANGLPTVFKDEFTRAFDDRRGELAEKRRK